MLRQTLLDGFHSNNECCKANLFLTLTQACLTDAILNLLGIVEERKISLYGKIHVFVVKLRFSRILRISIQIFSRARLYMLQGFMLVFCGNFGDSPNSAFAV